LLSSRQRCPYSVGTTPLIHRPRPGQFANRELGRKRLIRQTN